MKSITTFLLALTLAVVGVGGYLYLQRLESRVVALESQILTMQEKSGPATKATVVRENPHQTEQGPESAEAGTRPELASEAESQSYLDELLRRTQ